LQDQKFLLFLSFFYIFRLYLKRNVVQTGRVMLLLTTLHSLTDLVLVRFFSYIVWYLGTFCVHDRWRGYVALVSRSWIKNLL